MVGHPSPIRIQEHVSDTSSTNARSDSQIEYVSNPSLGTSDKDVLYHAGCCREYLTVHFSDPDRNTLVCLPQIREAFKPIDQFVAIKQSSVKNPEAIDWQ
jgi:hypothetical protein